MGCIMCACPTEDNTVLPKDHSYCDDCYFNIAIEGPDADYVRDEDGNIVLLHID